MPREIRDCIYGYLHQPATFDWKVNQPGICCAKVDFKMAPLLSVLLTCSRFKDEYLGSCVYRELTAVITTKRSYLSFSSEDENTRSHADDGCGVNWKCRSISTGASSSAIAAIFGPVKHICLSFIDEIILDSIGLNDVGYISNALGDLCASLLSLKVAVYYDGCGMEEMVCLRGEREFEQLALSAALAPPALPGSSCGLHLAQACVGYRLQLTHLCASELTLDDLDEYYYQPKFDLSLYTKSGKAEEGLKWRQEQINDVFPMDHCMLPLEDDDTLPDWVTEDWIAKEYGSLATDIMGWQEWTGDQLIEDAEELGIHDTDTED